MVRSLYAQHRLQYFANRKQFENGNYQNLSEDQTDTIDAVLLYYGKKSSQWLSDLTHMEDPWIDARRGLEPGERGENEITQVAMAEYYASIQPDL